MANTAQSRKRARQNDTKRAVNAGRKSTTRSAIKLFRKTLSQKNSAEAAKALIPSTQSALAKAASSGIMPKNTARRLLSRLNAASKKASQA